MKIKTKLNICSLILITAIVIVLSIKFPTEIILRRNSTGENILFYFIVWIILVSFVYMLIDMVIFIVKKIKEKKQIKRE